MMEGERVLSRNSSSCSTTPRDVEMNKYPRSLVEREIYAVNDGLLDESSLSSRGVLVVGIRHSRAPLAYPLRMKCYSRSTHI